MTKKVKPLPCDCSQGDKIDMMHDLLIDIKATIKPLKDNGRPGIITRFIQFEGSVRVLVWIVGVSIPLLSILVAFLFTKV